MRMLPAKSLQDSSKYYTINQRGVEQWYRLSADGRKWYAQAKDGGWRKCPPNISLMLTQQVQVIEKERASEELATRLATPTEPEQPSASASEAGSNPASNAEP